MYDGQAVVFKHKVYFGGGVATEHNAEVARTIYFYDPSVNTWGSLPPSPVHRFGLTVYKEKLLLIGGKDCSTGVPTNLLWSFDEDTKKWVATLPPMSDIRYGVAAVVYNEKLLVIGGHNGRDFVDTVEVYDASTEEWLKAAQLPKSCSHLKVATDGEAVYLAGGHCQEDTVFCAYFDSLLRSTPACENVWETLSRTSLTYSSCQIFRHLLFLIGGQGPSPSNEIRIYSPHDQFCKWKWMGGTPMPLVSTCAVMTDEEHLLVIGGKIPGKTADRSDVESTNVFKATITGTCMRLATM